MSYEVLQPILNSPYRAHRKSGLTAVELLLTIISVFLAWWLAGVIGLHFEGAWRWVVFVSVLLIGYVVIFVCLFFTLLWLVGYAFERIDAAKHLQKDTKSDT